jgi:esterase/lipase
MNINEHFASECYHGSTYAHNRITHPDWREKNGPFILSHGQGAPAVILLHALTGSAGTLAGLAALIHELGFTVVVPLLPGHGLKNPDKYFKDHTLDVQWTTHVDNIVDFTARVLVPSNMFIGGHSAGGALALNQVLRAEYKFAGLLMFAPAIDMFEWNNLARLPGALYVAEKMDGTYMAGNDYETSYSKRTYAGGIYTTRIVDANAKLLHRLEIPVFAAQALDDDVCDPLATEKWIAKNCGRGEFLGQKSMGTTHYSICYPTNPRYLDLVAAVGRFLTQTVTKRPHFRITARQITVPLTLWPT